MQESRISRAGALRRVALAALVAGSLAAPAAVSAQWSQTYEQFYLPGKFNWTFRREYPGADRLFNAFDYGHAILYERLYTDPTGDPARLERDEYDFITKKLLVSPPNVPLEEAAIEVAYAKLAPEAKMMFDWAHLLHRQIYDVLASEAMSQAEKDAMIARLVRYYKTRPDVAFSSTPKNMDLMESQPYSLAFRQRYPKFNGLIWAYHWLQVGLYEPMMVGKTQEARQAGVTAAVARFRQMLEDAPEHMPRVMPMTAAIAPTFAERYPEASIIFDNLHAMHDVVSDILTNNDKVPPGRKRAAILEAASRYRDATSFPMTIAEWKSMGEMMGIENMGGPAVGFLAAFQAPTLERGASMAEAMKGMAGMQHGATGAAAKPAMPGMSHGADTAAGKKAMPGMASMPGMSHGADSSVKRVDMKGMPMGADSSSAMPVAAMMDMHRRMMADPVIRARVAADTALRRMMMHMDSTHGGMRAMPAMDMSDHANMPGMSHAAPARPAAPIRATRKASGSKTRPASAKKPASAKSAPAKKPAPKAPPMDHSKMPGMKGMPGMKP